MMTMKPVPLLALVALAFGSPVSAQDQTTPAPSADGAERLSILITYGDEECPETTSAEIVVCAQEPESERYRRSEERRVGKECVRPCRPRSSPNPSHKKQQTK